MYTKLLYKYYIYMEPLCKDKNNKINKCDDYGQHCVGEGMGGHPGAFTDVYLKDGDKCFTACGKKINKDTLIEYDFYMKLFDNTRVLPDHLKQFRNNMPKFYKNDTCKKEWKEKGFWLWGSETKSSNYFVIENIKVPIGDNAKTLDFKIGKKTAFKSDKGTIGRIRHWGIDGILSRSEQLGFRLEGATDAADIMKSAISNKKYSGWFDTTIQNLGKKKLQSGLYTLVPEFVWDTFIDTKEQASSLKSQFETFNTHFIMPNMEAETLNKETIGFIGSSILIVKGDKGITFKLIDFAHPFWNTIDSIKHRKHKEIVLNYCEGLKNFVEIYNNWYNNKYFDQSDDNHLQKYTNKFPESSKPSIGAGKKKTRNKKRNKKRKKTKKKKKRYKTRK
jgi:hypothetical protein